MCFSIHSSNNCCSPTTCECYVLHSSVETLFKWGGKCLHYCMTNLIYVGQDTPNFIRIGWVSFKIWQTTFWCVFRFTQCSSWLLQQLSMYHLPAAQGPLCIPMRSLSVSSGGRWRIVKRDTWSSKSRAILQIFELYKVRDPVKNLKPKIFIESLI